MRKISLLLSFFLLIGVSMSYTLPGHSVIGNLNMTSKNIISLGTPSNATDAVTKAYVDTALTTGYLPLAGGAMSGQINFFGIAAYNLSSPSNASDAATKAYADAINASAYAWTNTSNSSMKDYVEAEDQDVMDYVNSSNTSMKSYVDRKYWVSCTTATAQAIGNHSLTTLTYGTEVSDAYNLWNGTTFTAPVDGYYLIDGSMFTSSYTGNAGDPFSASVRHNTTALLTSFLTETAGTNYVHHRFNKLMYLEGTSTIQMVCYKVSTSLVTLDGDATHNWITIAKV